MSGVASARPVHVLLVCMGNICRSPIAHGVVRERLRERRLLGRIRVDSAGTHGYHEGAPPDPRAREAALRRGVDIGDLRARMVTPEDLDVFDVVLGMDEENVAFLQAMAAAHSRDRIHLFMEFATGADRRGVPDPYYGGPVGFERVLDMVEDAAEGLLQRLLGAGGGVR